MTETDFNLALSTCANSIHANYGGVTSKREGIEEMLRKYFEPMVQRLEQAEQQLKNSGELFVEFHNLARPSCHSNPTLAIKHALTEYKSLLAKVKSLEQQLVEARKDTERLDFVQHGALAPLELCPDQHGGWHVLRFNGIDETTEIAKGFSIRQAITLAMKEKGQSE